MPFLTINSKSLFYSIDEPPLGTAQSTTLFIHGLGSSSCFYKTITPSIKAFTRCISLDAPGSGLSSVGKSEQSISSIAQDAIGLLDALGVNEKVIVVGHSMGGIVANYIAAEFPERVKAVILLGPVNPAPGIADVFAKRIEVVRKDGLETLANSIPMAATGSKAGSLQHAFIRSLIIGTSPEGYISLCNVIAEAIKPNYGSIKVPLLILAGSEDKTAPLESSERILREYGTEKDKKNISVLEGVGHWHCVEASDEVTRVILPFVKNFSC